MARRATGTPKKVLNYGYKKRTGIGSGKPLNKHKRRSWKKYRGQGR